MASKAKIKLRKALLNEVKKYPQIWDNGTGKQLDAAWNEIGQKFNVPLKRLRLIWCSVQRQYLDTLLARTIERNNEACTWALFHHMSFMYEKTKKLIGERLGGISPPLLKRSKSTPSLQCPCCVSTPTDDKNDPASSEMSLYDPVTLSNTDDLVVISDTEVVDIQDLKHLATSSQSHHPAEKMKRRRSCYGVSKDRQSAEREKIINTIKAHPVLYAKDAPKQKGSLSFAWKMVAKTVGLPLLTIQNRWRLFKRSYVEELMRERCAKGEPFHSKWENFAQMSFMRDHIQSDMENVDRIRQEIHQIVQDQKNQQPMDPCVGEADHSNRLQSQNDHSWGDLCDQAGGSHDQLYRNDSAILTLDLISDTEDGDYINDKDLVNLSDDNVSFGTESSVDVYDGEIVQFNDIICIDDKT